ncbi:MAG: ribosome maturation factor RimM [Rhizobiaceae bacterium]
MNVPKRPVQMAVIGAAHGIKGELRVKAFTGDPAALGNYGPLYDGAGRAFQVQSVRVQGTVAVVRFKGVSDRTAAEALTGTALFVDRSSLPENLEDDEFYHTDLVGLAVRDTAGDGIGKVLAVQNFGGGDMLEVTLSSGREVLIPFTAAAVPQVALSAGFLVVDPIAAGLSDDDGDNKVMSGSGGRFDRERRPRGPSEAGGNR